MTRTHANMDDGTPGGSASVEAGLMDMLDRMQTGKFKIYNHLADWFEEFRLCHRKDGKVCEALRRPHGRHSVRGDDAA
jgi:hypothetical protein